jgi:hypothetical protein
MKYAVFWDMTSYGSINENRCFGGKHRLHLQGKGDLSLCSSKGDDAKQTASVVSHSIAAIWEGSKSDYPEEGGDIFLRNVRSYY